MNSKNQRPVKVVINDTPFTIYMRLTVHPTHNRYQYVLNNKNNVRERICWAPKPSQYLPSGQILKVYTSGEHLEFHF